MKKENKIEILLAGVVGIVMMAIFGLARLTTREKPYRGIIERKYTSTCQSGVIHYFYLKGSSEPEMVDETTYYKYNPGDSVTIE